MAAGIDAGISALLEGLSKVEKAHADAKGLGMIAKTELAGTIKKVFNTFRRSEYIRGQFESNGVRAYPYVEDERVDLYGTLLDLLDVAHEKCLVPKPDPVQIEERGHKKHSESRTAHSERTGFSFRSFCSRVSQGLRNRGGEVKKAAAGYPEQMSEEASALNNALKTKLEDLERNIAEFKRILKTVFNDRGQRSPRDYFILPAGDDVSDEIVATGHAAWNEVTSWPAA